MTFKLNYCAFALSICLASWSANARDFDIGDGWTGKMGLQIQAFALNNDVDRNGSVGGPNDTANTFRVQSGFDPSKLNIGLVAPETNDLTFSGNFQLVSNITSGKSEATPDGNDNFNVRIAELAIAGDFGTIKIGRGWQIMGSSSLVHDTGSLPGMGGQCGGDGSEASGTCGRIGYGYVWTTFLSGFQYASPNWDGFSLRVGIFEPIGSGDDVTNPRFEGEFNYATDSLDLWASFVSQSNDGAAGDISAADIGAELRLGDFALTGAYTSGTGISNGFRGPDGDRETEFYYLEADYTIGDWIVGFSYGEQESEPDGGTTDKEANLSMLFAHYNLSDGVTLVGEWSNEEVEDGNGSSTFEQDRIGFGVQLVF